MGNCKKNLYLGLVCFDLDLLFYLEYQPYGLQEQLYEKMPDLTTCDDTVDSTM
jgi:hypothetical protein